MSISRILTLGNVLVHGAGEIANSVLVAPGEGVGEVVGVEVLVGPGREDVLAVVLVVDDLDDWEVRESSGGLFVGR